MFGVSTLIVTPAFAFEQTRADVEDDFKRQFKHMDFGMRGPGNPLPADIEVANLIVSGDYLPHDDPFEIMKKLSELGTPENLRKFKSTTGQPFNQRWPNAANPLLIRFFQDIGYANPPYRGDCTPWCAATIAWCLHRAGYKIPADPASSQAFKSYGNEVTTPEHGDLCVFGDIGDPAHGHIGFFNGMASTAVVNVLGGNQGGSLPTKCAAGYPQSKIASVAIPLNLAKDRKVGYHYLIKYVRPVHA